MELEARQAIQPTSRSPRPEVNGERGFLADVHQFRGVAITLIVAVHVLSAFSWSGETLTTTRRVLMIVLQNSTILFVFIAGYLFHHLSSRFNYRQYLRTKLKHVILPYLILSVPAIIYFTVVTERQIAIRPGFYENPVALQVIEFYLTGTHLAPYWFIPMIALYYLAAPVFMWLGTRRHALWLLTPLVVLSCNVSRGQILDNAVYFFSVYLSGIMASRYRIELLGFVRSRAVQIVVAGAFLGFIYLELKATGGITSYASFLQKMVLCLLLLGILNEHWERVPSWVGAVATTSFGIYFLHSYFISIFKLGVLHRYGQLPSGSVWAVALMTVVVMVVCHLTVRGLQRVFGSQSRWMIGS